jgi:hypothetical protein
MRARWEEESTELIPRLVLARLVEESKPPLPKPKKFVVTISKTPFPPSRDDDFLDEERPSLEAALQTLQPIETSEIPIEVEYAAAEGVSHVASRTYSAVGTMLAAAVITIGAGLVVGMLFS